MRQKGKVRFRNPGADKVEKTMPTLKKAWTYLVIIGISVASALNYQLFILPNQFAPAGINGICTMIQYITGISIGYLNLLINVPLALLVYKKVSKPLAVRSMLYVVCFSLAILLLDRVDLSAFSYSTENGTSKILGPLTAGIIMGFCYSVLIKASAYTGGTDFISALIHNSHPEKSVFSLSFTMNAVVAIGSYFVYDFKMEPVLLCILYSFASNTMAERFMKNGRSAVRFEIVTDYPQELCKEIIHRLHHSATLIPARGMYSGRETNVLICIVNKTQIGVLASIVRKYPDTFAVMSQVSEVMGNFRNLNNEGREVVAILDQGDGKTV